MFTLKRLFVFLFAYCLAWGVYAQQYQEMISKGTYSVFEIQREAESHFQKNGTGKGSGYKQYKRWEYNAFRMADENGYLQDQYLQYEELQRFQKEYRSRQGNRRIEASNATGNWQEMGPTYWNATSAWNPGVGRITSIAVDENNYNHMIVGANTGGVWKTTDKGQTWTVLTDNFSTMTVGSLAMDPKNPSTYYWGGSSGAIYKTTDGGATWTKAGNAGSSTVVRIIVHPTNTNTLFAAGEYAGFYKSTNGGSSWSKVSSSSRGYDLQFKPNDPNTVYASGTGFYKSTDGGNNFSKISTGSGVQMIGVSAKDPNRVYVIEASGGKFGAFYKSTNSGSSFSKLAHSKNYFGYSTTGNDQSGQAPRDMAIAVNPNNADEVHIAGILTWKSTNGGSSFSCTSDWTPGGASSKNLGYCHADVDLLMFYGNTLYVGSDGGVFIAENTANVSKNYYKDLTTGMGIRQFYKIGVSQSDPVVVSGGSQDNGTSVMKGADAKWYDWLGADGMESFVDWNNPNILYGTSQNGSLYKSTNGGQSQSGLSKPDGKDGNWVTPFEQDPTVSTTVYAGYNQVYKSTNGGSSWTAISQTFSGNLNELKIAKSNNKIMYASRGSSLYKTTTGSGTWSQVSGFSGSINYISIHPTDPNRIALATTGSGKVYVSTNGGSSWTSYKKNLPSMSASCVIWQEGVSNGLYVGMNYGVYYIDDNLTNWEPFMTGIPNVQVRELDINYANKKLYAGTYGRGLWVSDLRGTKVVATDLAIDKMISSPDNEYCSPNVNFIPEISIKNLGTDAVTSATIKVEFNGKIIQTYAYQGNLTFGSAETIKLNAINNIGVGSHTLKIYTENPNGKTDENLDNNLKEVSFVVKNGKQVQLVITFDKYPKETSWEIIQNGVVVTSSPTYDGQPAGSSVTETLCLTDGCFQLKMKDTYGDGISENPAGNYYILDPQTGKKLVEMTSANFGNEILHDFCSQTIKYDYDVAILDLTDVPTELCGTEFSPKVTIQNLGEKTLTAVTLKVMLDGQVIKTINHTTSLAKNAQEVVTIPVQVSQNMAGKIKIVAEKPNNQTDQILDNNQSKEIDMVATNGTPVQLTIKFDAYPEDISWTFTGTNFSKEKVYTAANTPDKSTDIQDFCLVTDCYKFTINDAFKDGLTGDGTYSLVNQKTTAVLATAGTDFTDQKIHNFCIGNTLKVDFDANNTTLKQCDEVTFTANVQGTATAYAWDFGDGKTATGVGPHKVTYTSTGTKTIKLTVNGTEVKLKTDYITISENIVIQPAIEVDLIKGENPSCDNEELTFEPKGTNLNANVVYTWYLNGNKIFTGKTFTHKQFAVSDKISVQTITNSSCLTDVKVVSTDFVVKRIATVIPTIEIQTLDLPACIGNKVSFSIQTKNEGVSPTYDWKVDGKLVGNGEIFETTTLTNGQKVQCILNSSEQCTQATTSSNIITTQIDICTGVLPTAFEELKAYPVPTMDKVMIDFSSLAGKEITWTLYNTYGQTVHFGTKTIDNGFVHTIDMSTMPSGAYFLKVQDNDNTTVLKIEKK